MIDESVFTAVTFTGITAYGLALLFVKALIILLLAQTLSDQFEYSPASIRHSICLLALLSLAVMPLLTLVLPAWHVLSIELPANAHSGLFTDSPIVTNSTGLTASTGLSTLDCLVIIYLTVLLGRLAYLCLELFKVGVVTARADNADQHWYQETRRYYHRRVAIKISPAVDGPVTWGTLYPVILLPVECEQWTPREREMVLRHELGHIRRRDWLAQLLGQQVAILYWPVPGAAKALRALSLEAERACDDLVLGDGVAPADYAALLLRQARVNTLQATVALGKPSELAQRIRHIVSVYVDRAGERRTRRYLAIAAGILVFPFASIQAVGSFSSTSPLADLVLIPVMLTTPDKVIKPVAATVDIVRPVRPVLHTEQLAVQPDRKHRVILETVTQENMLPVLKVSMLADMETPALSVSQPRLLARQQPEYPSAARRRGLEGRVVAEFDIDANGLVVNPRITTDSSSKLFQRSVLKALEAYRYQPFMVDGEAIGLQGLREEFRFQLTEDKLDKRIPSGDTRAGKKAIIDSS